MKTNPVASFPLPTAAIGFKPEFLDFRRGIHVGNLEENERITRILKLALEARYRQGFVTERWGRGVFWQWIGFLNRANRSAKPKSSHVSFGCSKFFLTVDTDERRFECGLQVERGYVRAPREMRECQLRSDWDWQRLVAALTPRGPLMRELKRLADDEFEIQAGSWSEPHVFRKSTLPAAARLRALLDRAPATEWCGFQVYFPMDERDVQAMTGTDLVDTMMAVFEEVRPAMNACMQVAI
jgi:hypothetical protein